MLALLWMAFVVLSIVAFFAILVTGRYPRGDLRLQRRRAAVDLAGGVLRLRRARHRPLPAVHPGRGARLPGHLDVAYPEHLSRGLVLVKWWLLALPHYLVLAFFLGGGGYVGIRRPTHGLAGLVAGGGLIGLLVLIAGVLLLFTGRYPRGVFDLLVGLQPLGAAGRRVRRVDDRRVPAVPARPRRLTTPPTCR